VQFRLGLCFGQIRIGLTVLGIRHISGFGYCDGYGALWSNNISLESNVRDIFFHRCGYLIQESGARKIRPFDEELWLYSEDQDLGWRYGLLV
jgi:GT2 family glycosyltransferase